MSDLDKLPDALRDPHEQMPWDAQRPSPVWQWGDDCGRPIAGLSTSNLLAKRQWLETRGDIRWVQEWITAIDDVLTERGGE